jgi:hypothetical protein
MNGQQYYPVVKGLREIVAVEPQQISKMTKKKQVSYKYFKA